MPVQRPRDEARSRSHHTLEEQRPAMPQKNQTPVRRRRSSREHARWVQEHARIDDSAFPEYPNDPARRGASRGALPNGNPWRPERDDQTPGPTWAHPTNPSSVEPTSPRVASELPRRTQRVEAPPRPNDRGKVRGITAASTRTDRRIAEDITRRFSDSKNFDAKLVWIEVHGKEVFLRGRLPSRNAKGEAQLLASSVRGVTRVHNEIRVGKSA